MCMHYMVLGVHTRRLISQQIACNYMYFLLEGTPIVYGLDWRDTERKPQI